MSTKQPETAEREPVKRRKAEPWSMPELNRIVTAARSMPEFVGTIPGRHFWPALILVILDLEISAETAVQLPAHALDTATGRISVDSILYQLHALTMEALNALPAGRDRLVPWPKDSGKPPFHMLCRDYKSVLFRAGLPFTRLNSFVRLQVTARRVPDVLSHVRPILDFIPIDGKPQLVRARDRRRHATAQNRRKTLSTNDVLLKRRRPREQRNLIVPARVPTTDNPSALLNVFRSKYRPTKLRQATEDTAAHYERSILLLYSFAGRELSCSDLTDELIEEFLSDCFSRGVKAGTCNHYRADLLALWRFAWRKRFTNEQPRDVEKLRVEEPLPDAWTTTELEAIVATAAQQPGDICDIPAAVYWPALLLCVYDSGLRFNALMTRPASDLDLETGWLNIDAADQKQRKAQAFKLHSDTLNFLRQMQPADRPHLFPWPYKSTKTIISRYRSILEQAGLPSTKRDLFHKLRRTSATNLAMVTDENTARDHLGHSTVEVTRRYLDRRKMQPIAAADLMNRPRVGSAERS